MKEIGGFFELELATKKEYHKDAIRLNYGRNAIEYILQAKQYKRVYLPYYICNSALEPINKLEIKYEYYHIEKDFRMKFDFKVLKKNELLIYVNYFGICDDKIDELVGKNKLCKFQLCIDNTQSFFSYPKEDMHTIYSARKFFGVPDGAYLYTDESIDNELEYELGYDKSEHLIKRIDVGASKAYSSFKNISRYHRGQPIRKMSKLSQKMLGSIDYRQVIEKRLQNFKYLHSLLQELNEINIDNKKIKCPMVYPFLNNNMPELRDYLIKNRVYVAQYWSEVLDLVSKDSVEYNLAFNLIPIPIDQRYDLEDMKHIFKIIQKYINNK